MRLVIEEANRSLGTVRGLGVDSFESLLEHFLLSGAVLAEIKKTIWEISNIRNVIVHRNSVADRRLIKHCAWLNMQVGDKVVITHEQLERYGDALCSYAEIIINRLAQRHAPEMQLIPMRARFIPASNVSSG